MNYQKIYNNLTEKAKNRVLDKNTYTEKHHIIPRCMKGSDDKENLVKLTAREHFIAHLLLSKIYYNNIGLALAIFKMSCSNSLNNKNYEWIKINFCQKISKLLKGTKHSIESRKKIKENHADFSGSNHPNYGKKMTLETKEKISKANKGKIAWNRGLTKETDIRVKKYSISQSITKKRFCYTGKNNSNAKTFIFTDIYNIEYNVTGEFKKFCKEKNLCYKCMYYDVLKKGQKRHKGWKVRYSS